MTVLLYTSNWEADYNLAHFKEYIRKFYIYEHVRMSYAAYILFLYWDHIFCFILAMYSYMYKFTCITLFIVYFVQVESIWSYTNTTF